MTPIREWRIHLGAHKTATTHLQDRLAAHRATLVARGVDFIPRAALRTAAFPPGPGRRGWRRALMGVGMPPAFARAVAPLRLGPEVIAISEENLPGLTPALLAEPIYPQLEARLAGLRGLARWLRLELFLGIRAFDEAAPSAYAQALRANPPPPGGFEAVRAAALTRPPSWAEYAARLVRLTPGARLTIWSHEAYTADPDAVATAFLGVDPGPMSSPPPPPQTLTPPASGVAAAEALPADMPMAERQEAVAAIYDSAAAAGGPKYNPFTAHECACLREIYARDLARLRTQLGIRLIHPGNAE